MATIHWLHISDIHYNKHGFESDTMREALPSYIKKLSRAQNFNYLFCTGDLRYAPNKEYPSEIVQYFQLLLDAMGIDKKSFFVVLGNHDVIRANSTRRTAIQNLKDTYIKKDRVISSQLIRSLRSGRAKYNKILKEIVVEDRYKQYMDQSNLHFVVETDLINVVHVDGTIIYDENQENELILGAYCLKTALKDCNPSKPTVILSHYSIEDMETTEQKAILSTLKSYKIQLWFAGHKHNDIIRLDRDYVYTAQSGNQVFEQSTAPGFIEGELNTDTGVGSFRVHRWNQSSGWAVYQTLIDYTDNRESDSEDRSKYDFVLWDWLRANGRCFDFPNLSSKYSTLADYIRKYKGNSFLTKTVVDELKIPETDVLESLDFLEEIGAILKVNYERTQWEIIDKTKL